MTLNFPQVWFQNRRAKFRRNERCSSSRGSSSTNSTPSATASTSAMPLISRSPSLSLMKPDPNNHPTSQMDLSFPTAAAIGFHTLNVYSNAYSQDNSTTAVGQSAAASCAYFPANYYNPSYHHHHHHHPQHGLMNLQRAPPPQSKAAHDYPSSG